MKKLELKRNDLCYGDFVYYNGEVAKVVKVMSNGYELSVVDRNGTEYDVQSIEKEIEPITISQKLIDKLGFVSKKEYYADVFLKKINGYTIEINNLSNIKGRDYCVRIDNTDMESIGSCDVQYMHQLQQIVRLATGKELSL